MERGSFEDMRGAYIPFMPKRAAAAPPEPADDEVAAAPGITPAPPAPPAQPAPPEPADDEPLGTGRGGGGRSGMPKIGIGTCTCGLPESVCLI